MINILSQFMVTMTSHSIEECEIWFSDMYSQNVQIKWKAVQFGVLPSGELVMYALLNQYTFIGIPAYFSNPD